MTSKRLMNDPVIWQILQWGNAKRSCSSHWSLRRTLEGKRWEAAGEEHQHRLRSPPYPQTRVSAFQLVQLILLLGVAGPQGSCSDVGYTLMIRLRSRDDSFSTQCFIRSIILPWYGLPNNVLIWEEWQQAHPRCCCCCCLNWRQIRCCSQP